MSTLMRRTPMKRTGFKRKSSRIPAAVIERSAMDCAGMIDTKLLEHMLEKHREQRLAERAQRQLAAARATADLITVKSKVVMGPATTGIAIEKDNAVESEPYRRLVAQLPCLWCGVEGYSQHAHLNYGKGLGMKTDDRTGFPLCCSRPGIEGCHVAYDNYRLLENGGREAHREYGMEAGRFTREQILKAGLWPRRVPLWP